MSWTPLPVGVESFEKLIENGCYYVDKTLFIKDLLDLGGEVNLFTREYSGRFYTSIPEIGNRRSDVKETALPF